MALDTNFNVNPYYDDYDEDKKFLRMLFKPGYAVQARELTQAQTLLQKQVQRFGNSIYKNGSVVTGGQTFFQNATYLKLDSTFLGLAVTANNFIDKTLVDDNTNPTKRALVLKVFDADPGTGDPKTLLVKQIYGANFAAGDTKAIRSFFWWGHGFSLHLILQGKYRDQWIKNADNWLRKGADNWFIDMATDPWQHHFREETCMPIRTVSTQAVTSHPFVKYSCWFPMQAWNEIPTLWENIFQQWIRIPEE